MWERINAGREPGRSVAGEGQSPFGTLPPARDGVPEVTGPDQSREDPVRSISPLPANGEDLPPGTEPAGALETWRQLDRAERVARAFVGLTDVRDTLRELPASALGRLLVSAANEELAHLARYLAGELGREGSEPEPAPSEVVRALTVVEWLIETTEGESLEGESREPLSAAYPSLAALRTMMSAA